MFIPVIFLVTLISAEIVIYSQKRLNIGVSFLIASLIVALFSAYNYVANTPSYVTDNDFVLSMLAGFIMFGIPTYSFFGLSWLLNTKDEIVKHIIAVVFAAFNTLAFPFIALVTVCSLGIDCV